MSTGKEINIFSFSNILLLILKRDLMNWLYILKG